jgi:hypothetical protein
MDVTCILELLTNIEWNRAEGSEQDDMTNRGFVWCATVLRWELALCEVSETSMVLNYATTSWTTAVEKYKCFMPAKFYCFFNHGLLTLSEVKLVPVG